MMESTQIERQTGAKNSVLASSCSVPIIILTESTPVISRKVQSVESSTTQTTPEPHATHKTTEVPPSPAEQDKFFSMISHSQRDRMDEQRCSIDPSRSSPSTPKKPSPTDQTVPSGPEGDQFFRLLVRTQSRRLDDQRVSLPSLPGIQGASGTSKAGQDSNYLCYMVSKAQSSRMEEQRCSLPHIHLSQGSPAAKRKNCLEPASSSRVPPRSASFSPGSEIERPKILDKHPRPQNHPPAEQDKFFSMISHSQRDRMDEQRCSIDPSRSSPSTPRHSGSTVPSGPTGDQFFRLLANTQARRLDDQRATLPSAPQIQNGGSTSKSGQDSNQLCYMVSKAQGSRMDEQRCSAPHILQSLGTPSAQKKSHPRPDIQAPDAGLSPLSHPPRRSASFNPIPEKASPRSNTSHHQQELPPSPAEQHKFFSMISHSQRDRMDEQRCSIDPSRSSPSTPKNTSNRPTGPDSSVRFFKLLANTQVRRLDDQRVSLSSLPGIQGTSRSANVIQTEGSPVPARTVQSGPVPHSQTFSKPVSPRGPPRSASFSPASKNTENPPAQVTLKLSMSFTPQQGRKANDQPCVFPEVFLTLGPPGKSLVVPLSPAPGRPLSLNLNLVPKEESRSGPSSPCKPSPKHPSSPRPFSPHPGASQPSCIPPVSPHRDARHPSPGNSSPMTSPISPDEDCFTLIQRVHTTQLQKGLGQGGGEKKGVPAKDKGKGDAGKAKGNSGKEKGKGDGKKDKKEGVRKR